ncbi:inhibitor of growth protein 1 homolog [Impatiens glandulifera]|uniref:inhibitor of growth protein 1 homolog n=1 Tax=Impatiens glandulifera TaxID=253017 RepID=UPI001FB16223|nr:inhibitor of growth protein 1 homolog [Impatiens glandulifera]
MKKNTYEINILNKTYAKFEKNFFKRKTDLYDCERKIQAIEDAEAAANKEKSLIFHGDDHVKKGGGSSRGNGSSKGGNGVSTGTISKRKQTGDGSCRPIKRGGGRNGDRGSGSGGHSLPPFRNLLKVKDSVVKNSISGRILLILSVLG